MISILPWSGTSLFSPGLFSPFQMPVWWTELNLWMLALQARLYESSAIISRVCLMELPGDRDLSRSTRLKRKALTGCLHTRTGCCRQLTAQTTNIQGPLLSAWAEPKATHGDDMLLFRVSDLWHALSDFSFRTWIRLTGCLQGFACTHQLTSAPPWPAGAPQPCLTCWHLKPALLWTLQHFLYPKPCKDLFVQVPHLRACKDTGPVPKARQWQSQAHSTWSTDFHLLLPQVFLLPLLNLQHCQLSQLTTQFSRHNQSSSPLICLAAVPGMQAPAAEPEGAGGLPACRNLPQKRSVRNHMSLVAVRVAALL